MFCNVDLRIESRALELNEQLLGWPLKIGWVLFLWQLIFFLALNCIYITLHAADQEDKVTDIILWTRLEFGKKFHAGWESGQAIMFTNTPD